MAVEQAYFAGGVVDGDKYVVFGRVVALADSSVEVDKFIVKVRLLF
jgi:hypothetical protein